MQAERTSFFGGLYGVSVSANCIFCNIVQGLAAAERLYETDEVLAFLDINPVNPGHALVIPKRHWDTVFELPPGLGPEVIMAVQAVGRAVMRATAARGLNVFQNNYRAAGQIVDHVHWHLVPRHEGDGHRLWAQAPYDDREAMVRMARAIREHL